MAINPVQMNTDNKKLTPPQKKTVKPYLEAEGTIHTTDRVHPLPPKGHLIHDNIGNSIKYFFKDIAYDIKSVKNGLNGSANDHQSGRLNDVGLTLSGILIATYLASKTNNPKARIMEYVGLGSFLTAMAIYPKVAINMPAKLLHGFDIDKEYIDDQGRKKSVMQDANYVPYDMYQGKIPEEDFAKIGDRMGIPRNIKNRNDLIREQMRKNAVQSQTLWMLTAGITPALAALMSCGLENYVVGPALEKANIAKYNKLTKQALQATEAMSNDAMNLIPNKLSDKVESILSIYKNQELPKEEFNNILNILTENLFDKTAEGIKEDLTRILETSAASGTESVVVSEDAIKEMIAAGKNTVSMIHKNSLESVLVPTQEEITTILRKYLPPEADLAEGTSTKLDNIPEFKNELKKLIDSKISSTTDYPKEFLESQRNEIIENITKTLKTKKSSYVSEESIKKISDFAKIIGEFKENQNLIRKCTKISVEHTNETIIARSYAQFEQTLLSVLGIKFSELKKMRESDEFTKELLDKKITELCKDDAKYQKTLEKLGDVVSKMEVKLNGADATNSRLLDLINAIENNYNKTAARLKDLKNFESTVDRLVKDVVKLDNKDVAKIEELTPREKLFDFLDGIVENKVSLEGKEWHDGNLSDVIRKQYLKHNTNGVGSSKNLEISRIVERYQGAKNSFNRILHTLDVYKRSANPENFAGALMGRDSEQINTVIKLGKDALLNATGPDHTLKLDTVNNPTLYKDIMNAIWATESFDSAKETISLTKQKGVLSESAKTALGKNNTAERGKILDRLQFYISRFRNIVGNSDIDFTKPYHILDPNIRGNYTGKEKTRMAFFNLIGQTPVDMAKGAAGRRYSTQKWVRIISAITGSVFGIAVISQFFFGKRDNAIEYKKQVNNDTN